MNGNAKLFILGTYQVQTNHFVQIVEVVMVIFKNSPSVVHQLSKRPFHHLWYIFYVHPPAPTNMLQIKVLQKSLIAQ
jgi:hypothetical protein